MIRRARPSRITLRSGAALTEFAVILPVLVLMFFGTIEACSMINLEQSLKVAAYEGTRVALVPGVSSSSAVATAKQILTDRRVAGGTVSVTPTDIASAPTGSYIQVTVSAPAKGNSLVGAWFYGGKKLTSTVQMMKEY